MKERAKSRKMGTQIDSKTEIGLDGKFPSYPDRSSTILSPNGEPPILLLPEPRIPLPIPCSPEPPSHICRISLDIGGTLAKMVIWWENDRAPLPFFDSDKPIRYGGKSLTHTHTLSDSPIMHISLFMSMTFRKLSPLL